MKRLIGNILLGTGLILVNVLHAQTTVESTSASDLSTMLEAVEQTTPEPATNAPFAGNFYSAQHAPGTENEWPPLPGNVNNAPVWDLGNGFYLLDDLGTVYSQSLKAKTVRRSSEMSALDLSPPNDGDDDTNSGGEMMSFMSTPIATNGLWLQITNVSNGLAYLNLMNGTDYVYEIFSKTDWTATNWNIENEVFPGINTNVMPFTVSQLNRTNLFIWARDWTGITSDGNTTPEWWFYEFFGTVNLLDTNLDTQGNTLGFDYTNSLDPNIISFSLTVTNQYVNSMSTPVQVNVTAGVPNYFAVLVNDTNFNDAAWNAYASSNINVNLGSVQGWHDVWVGLKGLPSDAQQTWQWKHLNLTLPPVLVITNPISNVVSQPMIQIYGYCQDSLASISYDISNAVGVVTNQPSEITDQYYDTNVCAFTTNYFECLDVPLTNGLNTITIHATDLAGDTTTTNFNFTLDYSSKTNPPAVQITWPQNGTEISGSNFTCRGWISDPTATIATQLVFTNGDTNVFAEGIYTNVFAGEVERNGNFWLENLPINAGTNAFTITITDAVGNTSVTNISVVQSTLGLTVNPVTPDSQLWQATVNLTGTISITNYAVWVNGVKGHNNGDGTWSASNVPTTNGGTASFTATAYSPTEQQPDGSFGN